MHIQSSPILGIDAYQVQVEVNVANGVPCFMIVGPPDAAVNESRERVRRKIKNSGFFVAYDKHITAYLANAE